ncbi:MAG: hypothetical protein ACE15E_21975 [Acidobacteriota bacterium]
MATWTGSDSFISQLREAEAIVRTAIALEPCVYARISGRRSYPVFLGEEQYRESCRRYSVELYPRLSEGLLGGLERIRGELCERAEDLDNNRRLHTVIRLSSIELREKLKGKIGGAVLLKTMAEILRRCCEEAFEKELPEEDEWNYGIWMSRGLKKELYGSNRLLDGDRKVVREFLRDLRLDYGTRLRWYVEGATEFACLDEMLRLLSISFVDLVNLRGRVTEKHGKGVAIRDSLRADIKNGIFSFVSIDGDRSENVSAVKKAAEDGEICGQFFISNPDFEFQNFAPSELEEIVWALAVERGIPDASFRMVLREAFRGADSASALQKQVRKALPDAIFDFDKGTEWGGRLARFALANRKRADNGEERPVVRAFLAAIRTCIYSHHDGLNNTRIDPATGGWVRTDEPDQDP